MESISSDKREVLLDTLLQVKEAIENLLTWNKGIADMNQLLLSPSGTQALAGNCMTIMAVAEGFRKIDKATDGQGECVGGELPQRHQGRKLRGYRQPVQSYDFYCTANQAVG